MLHQAENFPDFSHNPVASLSTTRVNNNSVVAMPNDAGANTNVSVPTNGRNNNVLNAVPTSNGGFLELNTGVATTPPNTSVLVSFETNTTPLLQPTVVDDNSEHNLASRQTKRLRGYYLWTALCLLLVLPFGVWLLCCVLQWRKAADRRLWQKADDHHRLAYNLVLTSAIFFILVTLSVAAVVVVTRVWSGNWDWLFSSKTQTSGKEDNKARTTVGTSSHDNDRSVLSNNDSVASQESDTDGPLDKRFLNRLLSGHKDTSFPAISDHLKLCNLSDLKTRGDQRKQSPLSRTAVPINTSDKIKATKSNFATDSIKTTQNSETPPSLLFAGPQHGDRVKNEIEFYLQFNQGVTAFESLIDVDEENNNNIEIADSMPRHKADSYLDSLRNLLDDVYSFGDHRKAMRQQVTTPKPVDINMLQKARENGLEEDEYYYDDEEESAGAGEGDEIYYIYDRNETDISV